MHRSEDYQVYLDELRVSVCSLCVARPPHGPPCSPQGNSCGIALHMPELVEICRKSDDVQMEPYIEELQAKISSPCDDRDESTCPRPLDYLLQLAVEAVERVERRRSRELANNGNAGLF